MKNIRIDISKTFGIISKEEIYSLQSEVSKCHSALLEKTGKGNDFLGWVHLPSSIDSQLINKVKADAKKINDIADTVIVIGIGGSYLGARAVIDALSNPFNAFKKDKKHPNIIYAGNNISEDYHAELLELLNEKEYAVIVISKSGTTTEPAIAFRLLKNHLEKKYGKESASQRIFAITDKAKGALKKLAIKEGYTTYDIPDDVGGRYSVLTPVGLLPIAVAGIDISKLIAGAALEKKKFAVHPILIRILLQCMLLHVMYYTNMENKRRYLLIISPTCNISLNGGSNFMAKAKGKRIKEYFRLE